MTQTTLYGLPTCDTCRKARSWLDRFGVAYTFVDYRANPAPAATLKDWAAQLGGWEKLVNKSSTTWRNLLPQRKNPGSDPEWTLLLREYPALIRRPVVVRISGAVSVGFSDNTFKKLFGHDSHASTSSGTLDDELPCPEGGATGVGKATTVHD